jgi:hypothetical protein
MTNELRPGSAKEAGMLPGRIERARDLCAGWVKIYFSVDLAQTPNLEPLWNADLFQNVITSAVED